MVQLRGAGHLLILEGASHEVRNQNRKLILENLCSPGHPWTLVIVTADPNIKDFTENQMSLPELQPLKTTNLWGKANLRLKRRG
ncbi:hypothetical protein NITGR_10002 [Nitrospina gracilis 3/211]|uniref:Uncharacterized protein n=1 Tax=Nitrospina gracilis (strain 3/211) TaxID=1266370 RepID=M1Z835_NITG3|nr:hypothetical protein NITGR_10002 [Nitrospina gracilis 3/211]